MLNTALVLMLTADDPYLWLEDVSGDKALQWVREHNAETARELEGGPQMKALEQSILDVLDSDAKIPFVNKAGAWYYNFWKDAQHPRGLWRRTTFDEYKKAKPNWETVLDVDALGKTEKESWVFHGAQFLRRNKQPFRRCLITLSRGGSDAGVVREFDVVDKAFVKDGFSLPEAKSQVHWIDRDTLFVGTDFGKGSMTSSGYPRIAKRWQRGTPLASAKTVFEGEERDVSASAWHDDTEGFERNFAERSPSFFSSELFLIGDDGSTKKVDVPIDAKTSVFREWMLVEPRTPWTVGGKTYAAGSLLVTSFADYMKGQRALTVLFEPTKTRSLHGYGWTRHRLILNVLDDVKNRLSVLTPVTWNPEPFVAAGEFSTLSAWAVDADESDDFFMVTTDFLTPSTLKFGTIGGAAPQTLKQTPAFFDAGGLVITQHFVTSKDGTRVPYFQVAKAGLVLDGSHPTLLDGYGGFEIALVPYYDAAVGRAWLAKGGVFVVANIRGGGEYGPTWHQAALKEKRPRAYEDFAAVAQDLVARKVTSKSHLGIKGGSNGGLLMGNMLTRYPELFGAIVCQVPLLDMKRYSHLLAGASWMEEYGDPDKASDWAFMQGFSAYHNVKDGVSYPPILIMTSTKDDRVHPGHARKMTAKLQSVHANVRYYENIEGGHGGAADNKQAAHMWALAYTFLAKTLGLP